MTTIALEPLRRSTRITTRVVSAGLVQVSTPDRVLGHVRDEGGVHVAIKGPNPAWGDEVGRYATQGMALEALRLRKRSV
ncbi:hypothetical protein [Frigoribacterium faeni]|uniref:hypothetical protein n=1 Tax=Frigoribacterium faeni TaxID=145483 RepID=UPI00141B8261|nr:hypothetical protein [Frigoribacterium faeni]NIJ04111.1 hypothetical protein [Frigoribacterium faeni]